MRRSETGAASVSAAAHVFRRLPDSAARAVDARPTYRESRSNEPKPPDRHRGPRCRHRGVLHLRSRPLFSLDYLKSQQATIDAWYRSNPALTIAAFFAVYVAVTGLSLPGAA